LAGPFPRFAPTPPRGQREGLRQRSAFSARRFRARLAELGIRHRRGGYRDRESQAFIESWFGTLKEREVWLNEYETLDDARGGIGGYVDRYHHRPHSGLDYRTPLDVRKTWEDLQEKSRPELSTRAGSRSWCNSSTWWAAQDALSSSTPCSLSLRLLEEGSERVER
jgi:hypothetical protein